MNCPKCNSSDTQTFSILYESGSTVGSVTGSAIGASRTGLSAALFGGTTQQQTLLARRVAPPPPPPPPAPDLSRPGVIGAAVSLVAVAVFLFIKGLTLLAILVGSPGIIVIIAAAAGNGGPDKRKLALDRMERWRNSWLCLRCGQEFVQSPGGALICDSLQTETRRVRDTEGVIPAIKYYRDRTSVGLAEAKAYVDRL